MGAVDLHGGIVKKTNGRAHALEDLQMDRYVADFRNIADDTGAVDEDRRGHDGQRGIFESTDAYFAVELIAAMYDVLSQSRTFSCFS